MKPAIMLKDVAGNILSAPSIDSSTEKEITTSQVYNADYDRAVRIATALDSAYVAIGIGAQTVTAGNRVLVTKYDALYTVIPKGFHIAASAAVSVTSYGTPE